MAHAPCLGRPPQADAASADAQEAVQTSDKLRKTLNAVVSALMNHHAQALAHAQALPVEAQASLSALFDQELAGLQQQRCQLFHNIPVPIGSEIQEAAAAPTPSPTAASREASKAAQVRITHVPPAQGLQWQRERGQACHLCHPCCCCCCVLRACLVRLRERACLVRLREPARVQDRIGWC